MLKAHKGRGECEGISGRSHGQALQPGEPCGKPGFGLEVVGIMEELSVGEYPGSISVLERQLGLLQKQGF